MSMTGKTRLRNATLSGGALRPRREVLVLQVEVDNPDPAYYGPGPTRWRDATTEDLAELTRMQATSPWQAEP